MNGIKSLMKWAKPYKWLLIFIVILTILIPITYSYVPQFIRYVINDILEYSENSGGSVNLPQILLQFFDGVSNVLDAILFVGLTLLIFQLLRGILLFFNGYLKGKWAESMAHDMRSKMFSHIQDLSYTYHNNVDTGDLIQRTTSDIDTVKGFLSAQFPELFYIIFSFAAGAVQMGLMNVKIMLVTLCVAPISITMSIVYFKYIKKKFEFIEEVEANMTTALQENINGVRVVKAFAKERFEIEKFDKKNDQFRHESRKLTNAIGFYWGISDLLTMLQYTLTVGVAILLSSKGEISAGDYIAYSMYIGMLVWPIRGLGRIIGDFGKATVASRRIDEVLDVPTEYGKDGSLTPVIEGKIEFDNVIFKFDDTEQHLLNGVNFTIEKGETVAVIGKTGSGKSTIANLLVRMLDYQDGHIRIDGVDLKDISKQWIRRNIGIILQDPFLYAATVYDNISIANKGLSQTEIQNAAKTASIHQDIMTFDKGYETLVGEKGTTLSGGQKQRLAIARMLVLNKPVMIFDDSLSAVDTQTDINIRQALKSRNKDLTSIIITHRITTAKEADKIIVLENGRVSAIGKHDDLIDKSPLYKSLWDIQGALEEEFLEILRLEATNE